MFNIIKFCQDKKCTHQIEYNKIKTNTNDPSLSKKMRYSQYVNTKYAVCKGVSYNDLIEKYGFSPIDIAKLNTNAIISSNSSLFS